MRSDSVVFEADPMQPADSGSAGVIRDWPQHMLKQHAGNGAAL